MENRLKTLFTRIVTAALAGVAVTASAQAPVEISVQYPYPELFEETHKQLTAACALHQLRGRHAEGSPRGNHQADA